MVVGSDFGWLWLSDGVGCMVVVCVGVSRVFYGFDCGLIVLLLLVDVWLRGYVAYYDIWVTY